MSSNKKKNETLGMSHGTATSRLRKNVLFSLLKKHRENICIRCGEAIEIADDLSMDHIKPWEGISAELFWDVSNIGFSHMRCNRPHVKGCGKPRKQGPEGTAWCSGHQDFLPVEQFWAHPSRWNGLKIYCKVCAGKMDQRKNHLMKEFCGDMGEQSTRFPVTEENAGAAPAITANLSGPVF